MATILPISRFTKQHPWPRLSRHHLADANDLCMGGRRLGHRRRRVSKEPRSYEGTQGECGDDRRNGEAVHFERSRRVEQLSPAASLSTESNHSVFHQAVTDLTVAPQCPGCGRAQRGKQHRREKDHSPYHVRRVARPTDSGTAERQEQSAGWNGSTTSTRFA